MNEINRADICTITKCSIKDKLFLVREFLSHTRFFHGSEETMGPSTGEIINRSNYANESCFCNPLMLPLSANSTFVTTLAGFHRLQLYFCPEQEGNQFSRVSSISDTRTTMNHPCSPILRSATLKISRSTE